MCASENVVQIKNQAEWTFYASWPSKLGGETKNTERRLRERLLKDSFELQPLTQIPNVNHLWCTGNCIVGRKGQGRSNTGLGVYIPSGRNRRWLQPREPGYKFEMCYRGAPKVFVMFHTHLHSAAVQEFWSI